MTTATWTRGSARWAKNLTEPLALLPVGGDISDGSLPPGTHPLWDRDEVHDIYAPRLDCGLGLRRARAAVLIVLALPGSAYLYQGEELGLHEVPDIPVDLVQDPSYARSQGAEKGRDGCRVPLPWTSGAPAAGAA